MGYGASRNLFFSDEPSKILKNEASVERVESLFNPNKVLIDPENVIGLLSGEWPIVKEDEKAHLSQYQIDNILLILNDLFPEMNWLPNISNGLFPQEKIAITELSDGYKCMLSWLLHLIVHLYASTGWQDNIRKVRGVVLIDEIDLHLHPQWQRTIITKLSKAFPKLQFIATTHSPMTLGGLPEKGSEIFVLKKLKNEVVISKNMEDVQGWRADQILTSSLFGLETTRDVVTQNTLYRYKELLLKEKPSGIEESELRQLGDQLRVKIPSTHERMEARDAYKIILANTESQWQNKSPEEKAKILREIELELQRVIAGAEIPK
jgi:hypothetical protein